MFFTWLRMFTTLFVVILRITLKNAQILFAVNLVNVPVCGILYYLQLEGIAVGLGNILLLVAFIFFILSLGFFIKTFLVLKEATAVIAAYTMFTVILLINGIALFFPRLLNGNYTLWLGTLTLVIGVLVAFRSFFVKAEFLRPAFMVFGAGMGLLTLPRLFVLFVSTKNSEEIVRFTNNAGIIALLFGLCFVSGRIVGALKANNGDLTPSDTELELPEGEI